MPDRRGAPDYAMLKDRRGALQYLLIPARRVSGIEDPALLGPDADDYLADAWRERRWMDALHGASVPREDVALALNSAWVTSPWCPARVRSDRPLRASQIRAVRSLPDVTTRVPSGLNEAERTAPR